MRSFLAVVAKLVVLFLPHNIESNYTLPNIILLYPDQWRFDWADQYYIKGLSIKTPTFSEFVRRGTRFVNALVPSPLCAPSRACLASGKEYDYSGVPTNEYDFPIDKQQTIYKLMQNNGYFVMVSGKDDLTKSTTCGVDGNNKAHGLGFSDQRRCRGKKGARMSLRKVSDPYSSYLVSKKDYDTWYDCFAECCVKKPGRINEQACPISINISTESYQDNYITDRTIEMLKDAPHNQPWFLQINWAGPHPPFHILQSMNETVNNRTYAYPMKTHKHDAQEILIARRDYTAEIENIDSQMRLILDFFKEHSMYENSIFCISSDHGEMLGDFGEFQKQKPWVASTNVPFVCMGPGIIANQIIQKYVTNMDLAGTFLDYAQTKQTEDMTTVSLRPFLNGTWNDANNDYRQFVLSGLKRFRVAVETVDETTTWKFICCKGTCASGYHSYNVSENGHTQLLFNVTGDLYETKNLADVYPFVVERMKSYLPWGFCGKNAKRMTQSEKVLQKEWQKLVYDKDWMAWLFVLCWCLIGCLVLMLMAPLACVNNNNKNTSNNHDK